MHRIINTIVLGDRPAPAAHSADAVRHACEVIYVRLGYLLCQANILDDAAFDLLWVVSGMSRPDLVEQTGGETYGALVRRLIRTYNAQIRDATLVAMFLAIEERLRASVNLRNEFIHANWAISPEGWVQRDRRPRDKAVEQTRKMTAAQLETAAEELAAVAALVMEVRTHVAVRFGTPPTHGELRDGTATRNGWDYADLTNER